MMKNLHEKFPDIQQNFRLTSNSYTCTFSCVFSAYTVLEKRVHSIHLLLVQQLPWRPFVAPQRTGITWNRIAQWSHQTTLASCNYIQVSKISKSHNHLVSKRNYWTCGMWDCWTDYSTTSSNSSRWYGQGTCTGWDTCCEYKISDMINTHTHTHTHTIQTHMCLVEQQVEADYKLILVVFS